MASRKVSSTYIPITPRQNLTFAGRYVCDRCLEPSKGVYRQEYSKTSGNRWSGEGPDWICDSCLNGKVRVTYTAEQKQAQKVAMTERFVLARQAHAASSN
jgi:hypothetical protein